MDRDEEMLRLLENVVTELQHIKDKVANANTKLDSLVAGQLVTNTKLDQIIENTTPIPSDDITELGGSISTPTKQNP